MPISSDGTQVVDFDMTGKRGVRPDPHARLHRRAVHFRPGRPCTAGLR